MNEDLAKMIIECFIMHFVSYLDIIGQFLLLKNSFEKDILNFKQKSFFQKNKILHFIRIV